MNLYHLSQDTNNGYDTYSACIVAAESSGAARKINPSRGGWTSKDTSWAYEANQVSVELIGRAKLGTEAGIILSSFHAG